MQQLPDAPWIREAETYGMPPYDDFDVTCPVCGRECEEFYLDEDDDVVVTLNLDDGSEVTCEILTIFDLEDQDYIVLLPLDKNGEPNADGEVYIYRYFEDETGAPSLDNIESDEEYDAVSARFDEVYGEDLEDEE